MKNGLGLPIKRINLLVESLKKMVVGVYPRVSIDLFGFNHTEIFLSASSILRWSYRLPFEFRFVNTAVSNIIGYGKYQVMGR